MKKINNRSKFNKHGGTTMFLAIVLSAIILVECTYMTIVADFNRRLAFNRGVKLQVESILADYDRELFRIYGIYAFDINRIDDTVFYKVLDAQGIEVGDVLLIEGMYAFDTDDLRKAISSFYVYRSPGIIASSLISTLSDALAEFDEYNILGSIREFTSSKAGAFLNKIINGGVKITSILETVGATFGIDDFEEKMGYFNDLLTNVRAFISDDPDYANGFSISNMTGITGLLDEVYDFNENASNFIADYTFKPFAAHYAAYNFDSRLEDDSTINGTDFESIHSENYVDAEYILTGKQGDSAAERVALYIFPTLLVLEVVKTLNDSELMSQIEGIAEILAAAIALISFGSVVLSPDVYKIVILVIYCIVTTWQDMEDILDGDRVEVVSIGDVVELSIGYRDFLFLYMFAVSEDKLLSRMSDVLTRDYDSYCSSVTVSSTYRGHILHRRETYVLYE